MEKYEDHNYLKAVTIKLVVREHKNVKKKLLQNM